ncbi:sulfate transporter protein [Rutstroemia sp. NJR-2017a WRK4]|nr:sulfate transporter protein [Rutstroemia sp. NJR-2017a WRK4]
MSSSRPPGSPPQRPHSRTPSLRSQSATQFTPINPSGLRESYTLATSPENVRSLGGGDAANDESGREGERRVNDEATGSEHPSPHTHPARLDTATDDEEDGNSHGHTGLGGKIVNETTALLKKPFELTTNTAHPGPCNHGTFSPRMMSRADSTRSFGGSPPHTAHGTPGGEESESLFAGVLKGLGVRNGSATKRKKVSTTSWLAEQHGITNTTSMYIHYYIPFFTWIRQYKWVHLRGDLIAAITMASFYLPMALSYASNLAHVPPINGLYSFVFNPIIYAILGSCPQMVVGPEAAGSLLVGTVVKSSVDSGHGSEDDDMMQARVAGVVTGMAGAVIFIAGLTRLGFLDSVLSRPFLRGFISAVGFVIMVDQLIPEMGLADVASEVGGVAHGSSVDKLRFLFNHVGEAHQLTCIVAAVSFIIIMVFRELKKRLQPRYPSVAYIPDRFLVVVASAILTWKLGWDKLDLEILGEVKPTSGSPFVFRWPFQISHMKHVREAMGTSFLIALLGFFESSVAAKSLGGAEGKDAIQGIQLSPNRELVALGVANLIGGCFQSLPAFGGYGRSKVNASTGGKTPMSSILLSLITVICVLFLLPAFYYLPKAVLSSMITVVAWSLIEEAPHDIMFFLRIGGYTELGLMFIIFASTIFYSLSLGIAIGVGLSLLSVIKHSTRPRIQILGRIPGTNRFENAEDNPEKLEFIEGCLIVKIPEPLTFANTGDLKNRLRRLELYGTTNAHPALPRVRSPEHNKNVIFDVHGVTGLDGSGTQVLEEIVRGYRDRGVRVFFSRVPPEGSPIWELFVTSGILEICGGRGHFVKDVDQALRLTEMEGDPDSEYANIAGDEGGR